ncbi:uncharacterized protein A4U43_C01F22940 [Asparagus officinalis]|uniref:DDE Tnp4 domain-containing protein n=1 Tax=Asparagus officinalis TaxID=4686 RepID=A0A5P1FRF3_ASPOF|nr:uncharacterized protein A4U43_C01F22940 [Asparagus officinalis]
MKLTDLPVVLGACCVLHNICEIRKEELPPELRVELVDDEMVAENGIRSEFLLVNCLQPALSKIHFRELHGLYCRIKLTMGVGVF